MICGHELPQSLERALESGTWPIPCIDPPKFRALGVEDANGFLLLNRDQMERQTQSLVRHSTHRAAQNMGLSLTGRDGCINPNQVVAIAAGINDELWVLEYNDSPEPVVKGSTSDDAGDIRFQTIASTFGALLAELR